jgi:hypothetical protein
VDHGVGYLPLAHLVIHSLGHDVYDTHVS